MWKKRYSHMRNMTLIKEVDFKKASDFTKAVISLKENMKAIIEVNVIKASLQRQAYLAYLEEGFTKEEALELCKDVI